MKKIVFSMILHCRSWAKPWAARAICIPTDGAGCCRAYLSSHKRKMKLMKKEKREES